MAKMMLIKKVKSSSIVEVTTALVLVAIIFSMALMIYTNIMVSSPTVIKTRCGMLLRHYAEETVTAMDYTSMIFKSGDVTIEREVGYYENMEDMIIIALKAVDGNNKVIEEYKRLVYVEEFEK